MFTREGIVGDYSRARVMDSLVDSSEVYGNSVGKHQVVYVLGNILATSHHHLNQRILFSVKLTSPTE